MGQSSMITLLDAVKHNKKFPSFQIPDINTRENMKVNQFAKLVFEGGEYTERMWVRITDAAQGIYIGKLIDTPTCNEYIELLTEPIQFRPENIIDING